MATDATGTPTTIYQLPKFNVNNDAPSGLGGNAQMDAVDAALDLIRRKALVYAVAMGA